MADDLTAPLDAWLARALRALDAGALRGVLREAAAVARRRNQARMARQVAPDGQPWEPRRPQRDRTGAIRRRVAMMRGLRRSRRLRIMPAGDAVEVGWRGRDAAIAAVHHHGRIDSVDRAGKVQHEYPARPLLGLPPDDIAAIRSTLIEHLSRRLDA
jgi:phage virion morphogenesis protein